MMEKMNLYPVALKLQGKRCLVVGGGSVAGRKIAGLKECGAEIILVSPEVTPELAAEVVNGKIQYLKRRFEEGDLKGVHLVICATDNKELNREIAGCCEARCIPVNVVDNPELSTFFVPSVVRRGPLCIGITTGGNSPLLARRLREEIEEQIGPEYGELALFLGEMRQIIQARFSDPEKRREVWEKLLPPDFLARFQEGNGNSWRKQVERCISSPWE